MIELKEIKYFAQAHFFQSFGWDMLEEAVIDHRRVSREERAKFKEEVLYVKKLLDENQLKKVEQLIAKTDLEYTKLFRIDGMQSFVNEVLPLIEKFEFKSDVPYKPLESLKYVLDTIILPTKTSLSFEFIAIDIQKEGDTFIQHFLQDLQYVEKAFQEENELIIQEILQISNDSGVYIFESEDKSSFIEEVKESLS